MALKVGEKALDFSMVDTEKKERTLKEFLGKKTVIAFFPGAFTGACTKEMCAFRDSMANLNSMNAQVVGVSGDSPFANKVFAEQNKLTFPILSDFGLSTSRQYAGVYEAFAGVKGYAAAKRTVFILDAAGVVKYIWTTENPGVEPPYDEVKQAVASIP